MGIAMFYHLTRSTAEATLLSLLSRALDKGWPVMIRSTDAAALDTLDRQLWLGPETGFLPHGREGGPQDAEQPVLLGQGQVTNGAQALFLLDGAEASAQELTEMQRVWVLFDGADPNRLAAARDQWRRISASGVAAQYWSEDSGHWEKKA